MALTLRIPRGKKARVISAVGTCLANGAALWPAACACVIAAPVAAADSGAQAPEVVVRQAVRECFTSLVHASGYLVPRRTAVVMFPTPGYRITEVRAKVGDTIKRGDIVARAVPANLPTVNPPADKSKPAETANVSVDVASPASGLVLQSTAFVDMPTSQTSKPLFTLAVDGEIEAAVDVPSVHIGELKAGQAAHLMMQDGTLLDGHVRRPPVVVDPASQMGAARLSIEAEKGLAPARFVRATIEARRSCGIGVPMTALRRTSGGAAVQIVKDRMVVDRPVKLGLADETDTEVTSGLAEGDLVVAGVGSSREGDRVEPVLSTAEDGR